MLIPAGRCQQRSQECLIGASQSSDRIVDNERSVGQNRTLDTMRWARVAKQQRDRCGHFATRRSPGWCSPIARGDAGPDGSRRKRTLSRFRLPRYRRSQRVLRRPHRQGPFTTCEVFVRRRKLGSNLPQFGFFNPTKASLQGSDLQSGPTA
jgi:hypothetical protein